MVNFAKVNNNFQAGKIASSNNRKKY